MVHNKQIERLDALPNEWVMRLQVICGEECVVGDSPEGRRLNYPIVGGTFSGTFSGTSAGDSLRGTVLPGGADWYLARRDELGQPDARYSLRTDDGVVINVSNRALLRYAPGVREQDIVQWPPAPEQYRCNCAPQFQAPAGRYQWLNESVFIGEICYDSADGVTLDIYRLT